MYVRCVLFFSLLCFFSAGVPNLPAEEWTATSVAWLATGDDGKFVNPRAVCSPERFVGTAWEERHSTWSRAGFTLHAGDQWLVYTLPRRKEIRGISARWTPYGIMVCYGCESAVRHALLDKGRWNCTTVYRGPARLYDCATGKAGTQLLLYQPEDDDAVLHIARAVALSPPEPPPHLPGQASPGCSTASRPPDAPFFAWKDERLPSHGKVLTARLAVDSHGDPTAVFLSGSTDGTTRLYRAVRMAGGWQVRHLDGEGNDMVDHGRFGLAFDIDDRLCLAFMRERDRTLVYRRLDDATGHAEEPDPGCTVRFPQVDLSFSADGRPHLIYFVVTPDGGLQIRLCRRYDSGRWRSRMIDRTMSKDSLASCSLALARGEAPFLAYALGPARAVLLAYPKDGTTVSLENLDHIMVRH